MIPWASTSVRTLASDVASLRSRVRKVFPFRETASGPPSSKSEVEKLSETIDCVPDHVSRVLALCSSAALGGRYGLIPEPETALYKGFEAPVPGVDEGNDDDDDEEEEGEEFEGLQVLTVRAGIADAKESNKRFRADLNENRRYR
jgi:hypothetical protein